MGEEALPREKTPSLPLKPYRPVGNVFSLLWNHTTLDISLVILPSIALSVLDLQDPFSVSLRQRLAFQALRFSGAPSPICGVVGTEQLPLGRVGGGADTPAECPKPHSLQAVTQPRAEPSPRGSTTHTAGLGTSQTPAGWTLELAVAAGTLNQLLVLSTALKSWSPSPLGEV